MPAPNDDIRISQLLQVCEHDITRAIELLSSDQKTVEAFTEAANLYIQVSQRLDEIRRDIMKARFHPGVDRFLSKQAYTLSGDNQRVLYLVEKLFAGRNNRPVEKQIIDLLDGQVDALTPKEMADQLTARVRSIENAHDAFMTIAQRGKWQPMYQPVAFTEGDVSDGLKKCMSASGTRLVRAGWLPSNSRWTTFRNKARINSIIRPTRAAL